VRVAGGVDDLLDGHFRLTGARRDLGDLPAGVEVIEESHFERQSTLIVRADVPLDGTPFVVDKLSLEDLVLAYMSRATSTRPALEATR
jgi:ABC-2 type transport system ATP-binding protein